MVRYFDPPHDMCHADITSMTWWDCHGALSDYGICHGDIGGIPKSSKSLMTIA